MMQLGKLTWFSLFYTLILFMKDDDNDDDELRRKVETSNECGSWLVVCK